MDPSASEGISSAAPSSLDEQHQVPDVSEQPFHGSPDVAENPKHNQEQRQRKSNKHKKSQQKPKRLCRTLEAFLDLPREIRDRIYFWVLRPDCGLGVRRSLSYQRHLRNGVGTTKVLTLNQQIYRETVGLLLAVEKVVTLRNDGGHMFRSMFAFGKPLFFRGGVRTSQCPLPQRYCELNLVGLRHLALSFKYPLSGSGQYFDPQANQLLDVPSSDKYEERMRGLMKSARETKASQQTGVLVGYSFWGHEQRLGDYAITEDNHMDMIELMDIFLNAANGKQFQTAAEEDKDFIVRSLDVDKEWFGTTIASYRDPLVERYNRRAGELGVRAGFGTSLTKRNLIFEYEPDARSKSLQHEWDKATEEPGAIFEDSNEGAEDIEDPYLGINHQQESIEAAPLPPSSVSGSSVALSEISDDLPPLPRGTAKPRVNIYLNHDVEPFQLRPECRKCYELFASSEGLQHHLEQYPKHRIPFQRKRYNTLHYWAEHGGRRKCGKSYDSLMFLEEHLDRCGHRREGMIPRWKQDNAWMNRLDAKKTAARKARMEKAEAERREWREFWENRDA